LLAKIGYPKIAIPQIGQDILWMRRRVINGFAAGFSDIL